MFKRFSQLSSGAPLGASIIVASSLFYASYYVWITKMGDFFGGYTASAIRSVFVLVGLVPAIVLAKRYESLDLHRNWRHILGMVVGSFLVWGPLYYAVLEAGVSVTAGVNYFGIMSGMLFFGWLLTSEKISAPKVVSALLGSIGLWLVFLTGDVSAGALPISTAFISGFSIALVSVSAKRLSYNTTQATIALWVASALANVMMLLVVNEPAPVFGVRIEWLYLVFFAGSSIAASWLMIRGLRLVDAGMAGLIGLIEIVFSMMFGIVLFSERPAVGVLVGAGVIILASAIPYITELSSKKRKKNQ